jgi:hypothetical protein
MCELCPWDRGPSGALLVHGGLWAVQTLVVAARHCARHAWAAGLGISPVKAEEKEEDEVEPVRGSPRLEW